MKKRGYLALFLLAAVIVLPLFSPVVIASALSPEEETMEELEIKIDELVNTLDTKELQAYLDTLVEFRGISLKDKLKSVVTGDFSLDYQSLGESVLNLFLEEASVFLPAFAVIVAISFLCGALNSTKNGFLHSTMSDIIYYVGYVSVGTVVLSCLISVLSSGFETIENMRKQMELIYPLLLTLMAASGGSVSVAVYRPAVAFMSGGICELFASVVLPISVIVIVLTFVNHLSDHLQTEKLADFFKSVSKWIIGLSLGLFSLFLTIQGMTSAQYDGLSLRAVKYVVSGSVPLVGGFLSGSVELILAGSALIKNALGAFSVFLLVGTILRPLMLFAILQVFLRLSAAVTEPIGGKIPNFLSKLASNTGYFIAGLLCVGFLYLLTLVLLVCSSGVIF